jgi:hypothetical protein
MRPALEMFMTPLIGIICFAIIMVSWLGGVRYFKGIPAGLVAIAVGTLIAWGSTALDLNFGGMSLDRLAGSVSNFGFSVPMPAFGHVFAGFEFLGIILVTAIPFGIYDLVEAIDNVESASAAVFVIDRTFSKAALFALIGAAFTFFGFMHDEAIGFAQSPVVALAYLGVAGVLFGCARYATAAPRAIKTHAPHGAIGQPAS